MFVRFFGRLYKIGLESLLKRASRMVLCFAGREEASVAVVVCYGRRAFRDNHSIQTTKKNLIFFRNHPPTQFASAENKHVKVGVAACIANICYVLKSDGNATDYEGGDIANVVMSSVRTANTIIGLHANFESDSIGKVLAGVGSIMLMVQIPGIDIGKLVEGVMMILKGLEGSEYASKGEGGELYLEVTSLL